MLCWQFSSCDRKIFIFNIAFSDQIVCRAHDGTPKAIIKWDYETILTLLTNKKTEFSANVQFFLRLEGLGASDIPSEDDQRTDSEQDPPNWQQLVGQEVLAGLRPHEIKRQEVINGEKTILM